MVLQFTGPGPQQGKTFLPITYYLLYSLSEAAQICLFTMSLCDLGVTCSGSGPPFLRQTRRSVQCPTATSWQRTKWSGDPRRMCLHMIDFHGNGTDSQLSTSRLNHCDVSYHPLPIN